MPQDRSHDSTPNCILNIIRTSECSIPILHTSHQWLLKRVTLNNLHTSFCALQGSSALVKVEGGIMYKSKASASSQPRLWKKGRKGGGGGNRGRTEGGGWVGGGRWEQGVGEGEERRGGEGREEGRTGVHEHQFRLATRR